MSIYTNNHVCTHAHKHTYVCMLCAYTWSLYIHAYTHLYTHIHMYVHTFSHTCADMSTHILIQTMGRLRRRTAQGRQRRQRTCSRDISTMHTPERSWREKRPPVCAWQNAWKKHARAWKLRGNTCHNIYHVLYVFRDTFFFTRFSRTRVFFLTTIVDGDARWLEAKV